MDTRTRTHARTHATSAPAWAGTKARAPLLSPFLTPAPFGVCFFAFAAQLRTLLPPQLASLLPPPPPPPPASATPSFSSFSEGGRAPNPLITYSPGPPKNMPTARFVGGLAANRVASELERLTKEARARATSAWA
jgi:hypothetical protein